jgi:multisubunit Na+/H+ antiporter MnhG subunit
MLSALKTDTFGTIVLFWSRIWHACVVWAMVVLPLATLLALILRPVFKAAIRRVKEQAA